MDEQRNSHNEHSLFHNKRVLVLSLHKQIFRLFTKARQIYCSSVSKIHSNTVNLLTGLPFQVCLYKITPVHAKGTRSLWWRRIKQYYFPQ